MQEILAIFTPDVLNLIAWLVGAFLLGTTTLAGSLYVALWFGWM